MREIYHMQSQLILQVMVFLEVTLHEHEINDQTYLHAKRLTLILIEIRSMNFNDSY
jgi:hypothetical protein